MSEQIRVAPDQLRAAADGHRRTAEYLATVPSSHPDIQASLDSLGPIYAGLRAAARDLLEERSRCYADQAAAHVAMAENLTAAAALWDENERAAAAQLRGLTDERR